jgi:glycerol 3-phosphatase-2
VSTLDNGRVTPDALTTSRPLSATVRGVVCDLDGVVYRGHAAVPHAVDALERVRAAGRGVVYATNNAARTPEEVAKQLAGLGLTLTSGDVVTSSQAGAATLAELVPAGSEVLAVGGEGVAEALRGVGLVPLRTLAVAARAGRGDGQPPVSDRGLPGVLQGYGPEVGWADLAEAAYAVQSGAVWVATNVDATLPTARGMAPGNGTLVDAVRQATGKQPVVVGKPHTPLYDLSARVLGTLPQETLAIGDRLDTDIAGARAAGMPSLLVLTGVHGVREVAWADAPQRPRYIAMDLRALDAPYVDPVGDGDEWTCGQARVVVEDGGAVTVQRAGSADERLRCVVAAFWRLRDDGRRVPGRDDALWDGITEQVMGERG